MNCNRIKRIGTIFCELFAALTVILLLVTNQYDRLPLAFATMLLVLLTKRVLMLFSTVEQ